MWELGQRKPTWLKTPFLAIVLLPVWLGSVAGVATAAPATTVATDRCTGGPAGWQALFDRAIDRETARDWPAAEALYRQILQLQVADPCLYATMRQATWQHLAATLAEQGQFEAAIATYKTALNESPDDRVMRFGLEVLERQRDEADRALATGLAAIDQDPDSPWGYRDLIRGLAARRQTAQAWTRIEERLGDRLTIDRALFLADAAKDSGNDQAAIAFYRTILSRYPQAEKAYLVYGGLLETLGRVGTDAEVVAMYREAIAHYPMFGQWRNRLADHLGRMGQFDRAIAVYGDWIRDNPADVAPRLELAQAYERQNRPNDAIAQYQNIIGQFPDRGPIDRRCHVVDLTAYDRLVALLKKQNRLDDLWTLISQVSQTMTAGPRSTPTSTPDPDQPDRPDRTRMVLAYAIVALDYAQEPARAAQFRQRFAALYPGQTGAIGPDVCGGRGYD